MLLFLKQVNNHNMNNFIKKTKIVLFGIILSLNCFSQDTSDTIPISGTTKIKNFLQVNGDAKVYGELDAKVDWSNIQNVPDTSVTAVRDTLDKYNEILRQLLGSGNSNSSDESLISGGSDNVNKPPFNLISGQGNTADSIPERGKYATHNFIVGKNNYSGAAFGRLSGVGNVATGLIIGADGNSHIVQANDSYGVCNQVNVGGKTFPVDSLGADNLHGVSGEIFPYIIIPDSVLLGSRYWDYGDVTDQFPDSVTYTATGGNYYPFPLSYPSDLGFSAQSYLFLRGGLETDIAIRRIFYTEYTAGVGTKVWYNNLGSTDQAFDTIKHVVGSYSPVAAFEGGNGLFASGIRSNSNGNGADAGGVENRVWGTSSFGRSHFGILNGNYNSMFGYFPKIIGEANLVGGWEPYANTNYSLAVGYKPNTIGDAGAAINNETTAGENALATGDSSQALALNSVTHGDRTETDPVATNSMAIGQESKAHHKNQFVISGGKVETVGDAQTSVMNVSDEFDGTGWWAFEVIRFRPSRTYYGEIHLAGRLTDSINQATAYNYDYTCSLGDSILFQPADVSVISNYIYVGKDISDDTRVLLSRATGSTLPSPIAINVIYYVVGSKTDSIQVSTTQGGAAVDITTQGSGTGLDVTPFDLFHTKSDSDALRGRIIRDGGDGISTGVRTNIQTNYSSNKALFIRIDQPGALKIRWTASHIVTEVANE